MFGQLRTSNASMDNLEIIEISFIEYRQQTDITLAKQNLSYAEKKRVNKEQSSITDKKSNH